jgi:hypothetical protein
MYQWQTQILNTTVHERNTHVLLIFGDNHNDYNTVAHNSMISWNYE